ncbi:unnamed protein product [Schistosoma rodhaini]|nr:unnamed protein product [Schistosoma rodhaini]CAH8555673.1 unnamed protein product [Schistosoma rodhaini]
MKDTGQQRLPPLLIQSSRINGWLLSRKIIQTDYPKKLKEIDCKVNDCVNKYPEVEVPIFESPSLFIGCREFLEELVKTDNKTDFFGRFSPLVRAWTEIVSSFQKNNLYLAEVGDSINELAAVQVPRCKMFISDRQKNLLDLRQRLKEQSLNLIRKEELLEKVYKEFHVDVKEENVRLRLLEEAEKVPMFLTEFVHSLTYLKTALQLYIDFKNFVLGGFQDEYHGPEKSYDCCPTLKLLIASGHVMVFTWRNGCEPEHIEGSDDFVPFLLQQEKMKANQLSMELDQNRFTDSNVLPELNENAPNDLLSYTSNDISKMIELVKEALIRLTTSSLSQLMMIRTRIGYLDRLTDRLLDYRRQAELARTRVSQTQKLIDKALLEQQEKTTQLAQLKNSCKKLVSFLEDELSRICNRQVQITGQFCDL